MLSISLDLRDRAKEFCSILLYFGSAHYVYEVLPLSISNKSPGMDHIHRKSFRRNPQQTVLYSYYVWFVNTCWNLLFYMVWSFSPESASFSWFMKHLVYLGNVFHIEHGVITITLMQSRIEAIQQLPPPTTVNKCKSSCKFVNYLSLFCKDLQKILKPIYVLIKKTVPFHWTELHQKAFEEINDLLIKPPYFTPIHACRYIYFRMRYF